MDIHVTQEHIRDGKNGDCRNCPTHLALEPFMTGPFEVSHQRLIPLSLSKRSFLLPEVARIFIHLFDCNVEVEPFSFSISAENFICAK